MSRMYIGDAVALGEDVELEDDYGDELEALGGEDEIVGDDAYVDVGDDGDDVDADMLEALGLDDEIIGAPRRRRPLMRRRIVRRRLPRVVRNAAAARAAGGYLVRRKRPQNARIQVLPIGPRTYTAAETADVEMRPQRTMRIQRIAFASTITPFFQINSLNVGQDPQFVASGSVPAEIFSQVGVGMALKGSTANLGTTVVLGATNTDAANSRQLSGGIVGPVVY